MDRNEEGWYRIGDVLHVRPSLAFAKNYFGNNTIRPSNCMEVGVQAGHNAERIRLILVPSKLVLIDCWEDLDEYKSVCERFSDNKEVITVRGYSQMVLPLLLTMTFAYVYIDGDHSKPACLTDIINSTLLTMPGGIIAGHDYNRLEVEEAVNEVFHKEKIYSESGDWWVVK